MLRTDNKALLDRISAKGYTLEEISEKLSINRATFYRRLKNNSFKISDIQRLSDVLELSGDEAALIFLAKQSH